MKRYNVKCTRALKTANDWITRDIYVMPLTTCIHYTSGFCLDNGLVDQTWTWNCSRHTVVASKNVDKDQKESLYRRYNYMRPRIYCMTKKRKKRKKKLNQVAFVILQDKSKSENLKKWFDDKYWKRQKLVTFLLVRKWKERKYNRTHRT